MLTNISRNRAMGNEQGESFMIDGHSNDKPKQPSGAPDAGDEFAHLQDDFNSLISGSTPPKKPITVNSPPKIEAYEEPSEAFNDLAGAFSTETTSTASTPTPDDEFLAHLDQSFDEFKSTPAPATPPSSPTMSENDALPSFNTDELKPETFNSSVSDQRPSSAYKGDAPVHADISGKNIDSRGKSVLIACSAVLIVVAGSLYWYTMEPAQQSVQIVQGEQLEIPELFGDSGISETSEQDNAPEQVERSEEIASPKQVQASAQADMSVPTTLSTADAINLVTQKPAQDTSPATTQPITDSPYNTNQLLKATQFVTSWVILAPAVSKVSAEHYVSNFRAKYMDSEVLSIKARNKNKYFVRIAGFSSKQSAEKRNKQFAKSLGLRNGVVFKETTRQASGNLATRKVSTFAVDSIIESPKIKTITPSTPIKKAPVTPTAIEKTVAVKTVAREKPVEAKPVVQDKPKKIASEEPSNSNDISVSFEL